MCDCFKSPDFHENVPIENTFEIIDDNMCTFKNINVWIRVTKANCHDCSLRSKYDGMVYRRCLIVDKYLRTKTIRKGPYR